MRVSTLNEPKENLENLSFLNVFNDFKHIELEKQQRETINTFAIILKYASISRVSEKYSTTTFQKTSYRVKVKYKSNGTYDPIKLFTSFKKSRVQTLDNHCLSKRTYAETKGVLMKNSESILTKQQLSQVQSPSYQPV